jgi:predicted Zn-dependent protease
MTRKNVILINLIFIFLIITFFVIFAVAKNCFAAVSLIRDAETEKFLHELADPIFRAANINVQNIKIYIVNDDSINAFVSGGQNVFINSGLILKFKTPDALIGVIAHETGHIAAGHLARSGEGQEQAQGAAILSYLLGIGAIIAGSPDAAMALISGGSNSAQRLYLKFTRNQEEAADEHAIEYLDKMSYPAAGLVKLLEFLETEMSGYQGQVDEYLLSHPVSQKRIDLIKARSAGKKFSNQEINRKLQKSMNIVSAKLESFIANPDATLIKYHDQNDELSNYKKSIALFRKGKSGASLKLLNKIIDQKNSAAGTINYDKSKTGFLYELKGQILFESGYVQDSIIAYNQAIKLLAAPDAAQAKIAFACGILALKKNDPDLIEMAIKRLEEAKSFENESPFLFKQLAAAYFKIKNEGRSLLALAEFNLLMGEKKKCRKYAKEAKEKLDKSDKIELLHADDLIELTQEEKGQKK